MPFPPDRALLAVQRAVAASGPAGAAAYRAVAKAAAGRAPAGATTYARGSLADGDLVPGTSDVDLVIVADAHPPPQVRSGRLVHRAVYSQRELDDALSGPALTYSLDDGRALFERTPPLDDPLWLRARPGLAGPAADWRRIRGPERRGPAGSRDEHDLRIAVWLELQWWWRHAIAACARPGAAHHARLGAKLVAEGARAVLVLEGAVELVTVPRRAVLERALRRLDEEPALRAAARDLGRPGPGNLTEPLAAYARLCARAAVQMTEAAPLAIEIPLIGAPAVADGSAALPLADWRAVVAADPADPTIRVATGSLADAAAVAAAARGELTALREGPLLLLAAADVWPATVFRTLQCPVTDPASFALLGGAEIARFSEARGWSARDWARRAVAEHRARLANPPRDAAAQLRLARSAARAALLAEGELAVTPEAAAERLGWEDAAQPAEALRAAGALAAYTAPL